MKNVYDELIVNKLLYKCFYFYITVGTPQNLDLNPDPIVSDSLNVGEKQKRKT